MTINNFLWAQSNNANVLEPVKELSENGWRLRDIPKASNMNWIFRQISEDLAAIRKDLELQTTELRDRLAEQNKYLEEQKAVIVILKAELGALNEQHARLKNYTKNTFVKAYRRDDFNTSISLQMCMLLKSLVTTIRAYHPNFPEFTWPLRDGAEPTAEGEGNDNTELPADGSNNDQAEFSIG